MGGGWIGEMRKDHTEILCEKELQTDKYSLIVLELNRNHFCIQLLFFPSIIAKLNKTLLRPKKIVPRDHALKIHTSVS